MKVVVNHKNLIPDETYQEFRKVSIVMDNVIKNR